MSSSPVLDFILEHKLIAIVRGVAPQRVGPLAEALYRGGIRLIEVTFDQRRGPEDTIDSIKRIRKEFGNEVLAGAGTVLTPEQVAAAASAGASYIISPNVDATVIAATKSRGMLSIPGALTPSEIVTAHRCGADLVKLFPAGSLGVDYARAIMAPLSHIKLLAVGGVDETNLRSWLDAGFVGAGIGGGVVKKELIDAGRYGEITMLAEKYSRQV